MEAISIIITIISLILGIVKLVSGDKSDTQRKEYFVTANLKVPVETVKASGIDVGEAVTLQLTGEPQTVSVHGQGTSWTPVHLGNITDYELYSKVSGNNARARIYAINGDIVTLEFVYR
ncbi:hypothetical protein [uncultured Flavobacterium sp.]|uniref:hypothetical protein n=1 Tax=uncultured Flavobacterium sp. TaxID=165435 RepID=UPI0025EEA382|nr:hypothetical protein [uncultured Flavobacterium sp.]